MYLSGFEKKGRTIRRIIIFASQHPIPILRMSWEGLYVALSRVEQKDHIRLAIKADCRHTLKYTRNLKKNKYTDYFFSGFIRHTQDSQAPMVWDRKTALKAAKFDQVTPTDCKSSGNKRSSPMTAMHRVQAIRSKKRAKRSHIRH